VLVTGPPDLLTVVLDKRRVMLVADPPNLRITILGISDRPQLVPVVGRPVVLPVMPLGRSR
jgi:hypothetical protein